MVDGRVCTLTLGCQWNRSWHRGELKPWCCHRCLRTHGQEHNWYCQSQQQHQRRHNRRSRSPSPRRHDIVQLTSHVVVRPADVYVRRTIISFGRLEGNGELLQHANCHLTDPRWFCDVTDALHDPFHPRDSLDGTHVETQRRIQRLEGFRDVHT